MKLKRLGLAGMVLSASGAFALGISHCLALLHELSFLLEFNLLLEF